MFTLFFLFWWGNGFFLPLTALSVQVNWIFYTFLRLMFHVVAVFFFVGFIFRMMHLCGDWSSCVIQCCAFKVLELLKKKNVMSLKIIVVRCLTHYALFLFSSQCLLYIVEISLVETTLEHNKWKYDIKCNSLYHMMNLVVRCLTFNVWFLIARTSTCYQVALFKWTGNTYARNIRPCISSKTQKIHNRGEYVSWRW